jgi:hypothetical protein
MKMWKNFLPNGKILNELSAIRPGPYFLDSKNSPKWVKIFFQGKDDKWLSLEWDYFDVEFKFEVYGISIDYIKEAPPGLFEAGVTPIFSDLRFLLGTDWTRPARPGEAPENFDQIMEESGTLSEVPDVAISAGTALRGVIFSNDGMKPRLIVSIDETERYSLKSTVKPDEMDFLEKTYDVLTLSEVLAWIPPRLG